MAHKVYDYEEYAETMDANFDKLARALDGVPVNDVAQVCALMAVYCCHKMPVTPEMRKRRFDELIEWMRENYLRSEHVMGGA